jgi:hypothetical protein
MKVTNASQRTNMTVRIAAVIFFQRGFFVGGDVIVEALLICVGKSNCEYVQNSGI